MSTHVPGFQSSSRFFASFYISQISRQQYKGLIVFVVFSVGTLQGSSQMYDQFSAHVSEHRTHEGYLCKQGAPQDVPLFSLFLIVFVVFSVGTLQGSSQMYDQFSAHVSEHRTHEGYLCKQGALLKGWKQRWFVLDSMKHQVCF